MTPETKAYLDKTLTGLLNAVGEVDARWIVAETMRRMGDGGSTREWSDVLLKVLAEWSRSKAIQRSFMYQADALLLGRTYDLD